MKPSLACKPNLEFLRRHLKEVARERNPETAPRALQEVQDYLQREFLSYGLHVEGDSFSWNDLAFTNLLARLPGDAKMPRFVMGAHFDSVPGSPGADDNASGVACLLEVARLYAEIVKSEGGLRPPQERCVEFVAFNLEEYGMIGSRAYATRLKKEGVTLAGMLSLEMVGYASQEPGSQEMPFFLKPFYPEVGDFIGLVANTKSKKFLERVERSFKEVEGLPVKSLVLPANGWVFPDARLSDHSPFWDEGFSALLVTDTSFYRNPHYHLESDRMETLNLEFLAKVTEAVLRVILFSL